MTDSGKPPRRRAARGPKSRRPGSVDRLRSRQIRDTASQSTPQRASPPPLPLLPPLSAGDSFQVPETAAGHTVLALLRALRPGESWSRLRDRVQRACVLLNGVVCVDEARRVAAGEVILLSDQPYSAPPRSADVHIPFVDPHVVVVEKPSGMMTHRRPEERHWPAERKARQPALDEVLVELLSRRAPDNRRPRTRTGPVRCVHRLDRETSGLLVFARNEAAEKHLVSQFRRHTVHRVYWAIVRGCPPDGTIVSNLVRDRGDGRRGSSANPKLGQRAVTHVRCLEQWGDYSLVECRLETGRTNQIRIHLAEAGHPVCGDPKYGQSHGTIVRPDASGAPRLALHAAELGFVHPVSGEEIHFQMPFPPDLQRFASRLRSQARRVAK